MRSGIAQENLAEFNEDLHRAVECMKSGGIILYPTDTIWGIGCDAHNAEAVEKIFSLKRRNDSKSMLMLTDGIEGLEKIVNDVPEIALELISVAVNPLTIIYDNAHGVAPGLIAEDGSAGIRVTGEAFSRALCRAMRGPVVSTSANVSGEKSPSFFREISEEIKKGVDYIVEYRRNDTTPSRASQIIKVGEGGLIKIIRG